MLVVDAMEAEKVREMLEGSVENMAARHEECAGIWMKAAAYAPAFGMIGTLVGLICMLNNMSDPTSIGPKMGVALITTFYGSMLANWICTPTSGKLQANNTVEMQAKEIMIEGLLSIQAGENPRVIEEKLKSFLAPADRGSSGDEGGGEADG